MPDFLELSLKSSSWQECTNILVMDIPFLSTGHQAAIIWELTQCLIFWCGFTQNIAPNKKKTQFTAKVVWQWTHDHSVHGSSYLLNHLLHSAFNQTAFSSALKVHLRHHLGDDIPFWVWVTIYLQNEYQ